MERTKRKMAQGIFNSVTVTENESETEGAAKWNEGKWRDGAPEALNWGCQFLQGCSWDVTLVSFLQTRWDRKTGIEEMSLWTPHRSNGLCESHSNP